MGISIAADCVNPTVLARISILKKGLCQTEVIPKRWIKKMSSLMQQKLYKCQTKRNNNISLENEGGLVSSRRWIVFIRVCVFSVLIEGRNKERQITSLCSCHWHAGRISLLSELVPFCPIHSSICSTVGSLGRHLTPGSWLNNSYISCQKISSAKFMA